MFFEYLFPASVSAATLSLRYEIFSKVEKATYVERICINCVYTNTLKPFERFQKLTCYNNVAFRIRLLQKQVLQKYIGLSYHWMMFIKYFAFIFFFSFIIQYVDVSHFFQICFIILFKLDTSILQRVEMKRHSIKITVNIDSTAFIF